MVQRSFWLEVIENSWKIKPVVWLAGVEGSGKTSLCQNLPDVEFFSCDLPEVRRNTEAPGKFLGKLEGKKVALDGIHRLPNVPDVVKAVADLPPLNLILTGPVSLEEFFESLDPLREIIFPVCLTPMMSRDLLDFGNQDLARRFLRGGLPPFFLSTSQPDLEFEKWVDSFWSGVIQARFRLEKRDSFLKFLELIIRESGEVFEASRFASRVGASRPTVTKYLAALEAAGTVWVLRPFSTARAVEIISAPRTYAFDTGFLCHFRSWTQLREDDFKILWKHWVLNELISRMQGVQIQYWRDKRGHEVDFVLIRRDLGILTITAHWKADEFEPGGLRAFRYHYPAGPNWVVCHDVAQGYAREFDNVKLEFLSLEDMGQRLSGKGLSHES